MDAKTVLAKWIEAFNQHDADLAASLYHDDAVNWQVADEPVAGKRPFLFSRVNPVPCIFRTRPLVWGSTYLEFGDGWPSAGDVAVAEDEEGWSRLIQGLRVGDPQVVREFCERYGDSLHRLADRHLNQGLRRRVGPEDVVQSACRTFLRRARGGEFQLPDSEALWGILCAITLTKIREQARFHLRHKRGLDREEAVEAPAGESGGWDLADPRPTPAQAAAFAEQFQQVLAGLDEEERQLVDLKLQECTNEEAAERMGCSERTVRRLLKRVQGRLARILGEA